MQILKQSTAATVVLGPFVDSTDGVTAETALTIAQADIRLSKNGAAFAQTNNVAGATHMENGYYSVPLDATDTNTVGRLTVAVSESGALPVWREYQVVEEAIYDALMGASAAGFDANGRVDVGSWLGTAVTLSATTAKPQVDVDSIDDDATAADNLELDYDGTGYNKSNSTIGTCTNNTDMRGTDNAALASTVGTPTDFGSGTSTIAANLQDMADNGTAAFDRSTDSLQALRDHIADGANLTEAGGTGDHLTALPWNAAWDAEVQSEVNDGLVAYDAATGTDITNLNDPTAAAIADAVWDEALSGHTTAGTAGESLKTTDESRIKGLAQTGTLSTTQASTDLTGYADDQLIGRVIVWLTGNAAGEATDITDYASIGGLLTFTALTTAPANGDEFVIV